MCAYVCIGRESDCCVCVLILLHVSSYCCICFLILLYMCPDTDICVLLMSSNCYICVRILLCMCPHTDMYKTCISWAMMSSVSVICVCVCVTITTTLPQHTHLSLFLSCKQHWAHFCAATSCMLCPKPHRTAPCCLSFSAACCVSKRQLCQHWFSIQKHLCNPRARTHKHKHTPTHTPTPFFAKQRAYWTRPFL